MLKPTAPHSSSSFQNPIIKLVRSQHPKKHKQPKNLVSEPTNIVQDNDNEKEACPKKREKPQKLSKNNK
ncbi:11314_t:CDS:2 [Dentiscutata heterogama]|uniref:11314_t:CDS:1 n=1 Tax=Dentiscutata heterogama TaxID=1316150 RepID=A0ACA9MSW6_9GLOM|nr:11314_t:CDS:2 [Dentiscutata heterogama]